MAPSSFAIMAYREEGRWICDPLPDAVYDDLQAFVGALRRQPGDGGAIAIVDVDDEYFLAGRLGPNGDVRLLLSDATAAEVDDLAVQVLEQLGEEAPGEDELDEVWAAGDLALFADAGLSERELEAILDDLDLYADEMIEAIASRVGFGQAYAEAVGSRIH